MLTARVCFLLAVILAVLHNSDARRKPRGRCGLSCYRLNWFFLWAVRLFTIRIFVIQGMLKQKSYFSEDFENSQKAKPNLDGLEGLDPKKINLH